MAYFLSGIFFTILVISILNYLLTVSGRLCDAVGHYEKIEPLRDGSTTTFKLCSNCKFWIPVKP